MDTISCCVHSHARSASAEQQLFGEFFGSVDGWRTLMKEKQVIASGSAILRALRPCFTWVTSELDFFISRTSLGKEGLFELHEFLSSEGYSLANKPCHRCSTEGYVSFTFVLFCSKLTFQVF